MMGGLLNISHLIQDQPLHREISFFTLHPMQNMAGRNHSMG